MNGIDLGQVSKMAMDMVGKMTPADMEKMNSAVMKSFPNLMGALPQSIAASLPSVQAPPKCEDLHHTVEHTLEELATGASKRLNVKVRKDGSMIKKKIDIQIPAGSRDGDTIVFKGEGDSKPNCNPGDIVIKVRMIPHPVWGIDSDGDMHMNLRCSPTELYQVSRDIKWHDGRTVSIHHSSQELKKVHVFKGLGFPIKGSSSGRSDAHVHMCVDWPDAMSDGDLATLSTIFGELRGTFNSQTGEFIN